MDVESGGASTLLACCVLQRIEVQQREAK